MKTLPYPILLIQDFAICHHSFRAFLRRRKARRIRDHKIAHIQQFADEHIRKLKKYNASIHDIKSFQEITDAKILLELTKPLPLD